MIQTILMLIILAISLYALHLRGELLQRNSEIRDLQSIINKHGIKIGYNYEFSCFYDVKPVENSTKVE